MVNPRHLHSARLAANATNEDRKGADQLRRILRLKAVPVYGCQTDIGPVRRSQRVSLRRTKAAAEKVLAATRKPRRLATRDSRPLPVVNAAPAVLAVHPALTTPQPSPPSPVVQLVNQTANDIVDVPQSTTFVPPRPLHTPEAAIEMQRNLEHTPSVSPALSEASQAKIPQPGDMTIVNGIMTFATFTPRRPLYTLEEAIDMLRNLGHTQVYPTQYKPTSADIWARKTVAIDHAYIK